MTSSSRHFFRQVAGTLGVRVFIVGCSFATGVIVARWLGAAGVGVFSSLNVVTLLAITFGSFGLQSAITFLIARDKTTTRSVLANAFVFAAIAGSLLAAAISAVALWWPQLFGSIPPHLMTIAAAALPFQMFSYFCLAAYLGMERIRAYAASDFTLQAVTLISAAILLVALDYGIRELVIAVTSFNVALSFVFGFLVVRASRETDGSLAYDANVMRGMLDHGSRFFVSLLAANIILRGDLLIVNYYRPTSEAGVYAVATQASLFLHMIPNVISTILFPRTSATQDESGEMTCRVTRHSFFLMIFVCLAALPAAFLLPVFYGPAFADAPILFVLLLPGVFLLGIETIQVQHFTGLGLPRLIPIYWVVVMLVCVSLDVIFVPVYGSIAAAIVSSVSYGLMFVLVAILFRKRTGKSFSEAFIIRRDEIAGLVRTFTKREHTLAAE